MAIASCVGVLAEIVLLRKVLMKCDQSVQHRDVLQQSHRDDDRRRHDHDDPLVNPMAIRIPS